MKKIDDGLRFIDVRILTQLKTDGGISVGEISRRANIDKAWISRLVRELEDVDRRPSGTPPASS